MKTLKQRWIMAGSLLLACTTPLVPLNAADPDPQARQDAVIVRALERLDGFDYRQSPGAVAAVLREIDRAAGTPRFVELVKRFQPDGIEKRLLASLDSKNQSAAVESAELLLNVPTHLQRLNRKGIAHLLGHLHLLAAAQVQQQHQEQVARPLILMLGVVAEQQQQRQA